MGQMKPDERHLIHERERAVNKSILQRSKITSSLNWMFRKQIKFAKLRSFAGVDKFLGPKRRAENEKCSQPNWLNVLQNFDCIRWRCVRQVHDEQCTVSHLHCCQCYVSIFSHYPLSIYQNVSPAFVLKTTLLLTAQPKPQQLVKFVACNSCVQKTSNVRAKSNTIKTVRRIILLFLIALCDDNFIQVQSKLN